MSTLLKDLRYAFRMLRKAPGFTAVAVLTLGLGIGANTAIFSVVNAVLLRPLAYGEPERLVTVEHLYPSLNDLHAPVSVVGFQNYRENPPVFSSAAVETGWAPNLTGRGDPERLPAVRVTGEYFKTYAVAAALGRPLLPDDAEPGHEKVVVLSHGLWQRSFGGDPSVLNQKLQLNGESYDIVGVMPSSFHGFWSRQAQLWAPLVFTPEQVNSGPTNEWLNFTGRLKPGITVERAKTDFHVLASQLKADTSRYSPDWNLEITTLNDKATGNVRRALLVLLGAVLTVLLIACANVANLQLARAAARAREIAVRVALGASPTALIRQLLTESILLSLLGGVVGVLLAVWAVPALLALNANNLPPAGDIRLDPVVLGYALLLSLATGVVFGLAPALRVARTSLHETLKEGGRGNSGDRGGLALRRGLVVATVALALTLLVGAGLLIRSFSRLVGVDPGFRPEQVLTFRVALPSAKYPEPAAQVALFERFTAEIKAIPGVVEVGGTSVLPFGGNWSTGSFNVEGYQTPPNQPGPWGDQRIITPGFLSALDVALIKGRLFTEQDVAESPPVVVVDEEMVKRFWPSVDPIGKRITFNNLTDSAITWLEVVGVVGHTMHEGLDGGRRVQLYFPLRQVPLNALAFAVRTRDDPLTAVGPIKAALKTIDPDLPIAGISSMEQLVEASTGPRRFSMVLLGIFSGLAAALAAIGLYGVMSFTVTQRARELGVRLALGAGRPEVLRLVLGQGMRLVLVGVGIGLLAAFALSRILRTMLFNVSATDPLTFVLIAVLLLLVTLVATWLPARRATQVDPIVVLRDE